MGGSNTQSLPLNDTGRYTSRANRTWCITIPGRLLGAKKREFRLILFKLFLLNFFTSRGILKQKLVCDTLKIIQNYLYP